MYSLLLIYCYLQRYVFVRVVDDMCAIALLSSLFFIFFSDDIICYSKKLGRICAADGETFEFLSMYNL